MKLLSCLGFLPRSNTMGLPRILGALLLSMGLASASHAAPLTGELVGNSFGWTAPSTNLLNYNQMVPGRVGQVAPYVLFNSSGAGFVSLDFFNFAAAGFAFFEVRTDGVATGANAHPVVIGDTIHLGGIGVTNGTSRLGEVFAALSFIDIRLALGGERDWDFDWHRFYVGSTSVPEPAALGLLALGLIGTAVMRRRRTR